MFDYSAARSHMIDSQIRTSDVTDLALLKAFRTVSREDFVPQNQKALAYGDAHIDLGEERVMLRPRDLAKMIQAADIKPSDVVLDIACGRGYSSAVMSRLAETVVGLENTDEAVAKATEKLVDANVENCAVVQGELKAGASEHGPFNVIFVNGAVSSVSKSWLDQLANNGRLICIIQNGPVGRASVYTRSGSAIGDRVIFDTHAPIIPGFEREPAFVF